MRETVKMEDKDVFRRNLNNAIESFQMEYGVIPHVYLGKNANEALSDIAKEIGYQQMNTEETRDCIVANFVGVPCTYVSNIDPDTAILKA